MSSSSLPPPGWYGDPAGEHGSRWWDGEVWTDHVRAEAPNDDPPPPPGVPQSIGAGAEAVPGAVPSRRGRSTAVVVSAVVLLGLVAATALGLRQVTGTDPSRPGTVDRDEVQSRAAEAGCEVTADGQPVQDRDHLDPADAPPADVLYPERPTHSGPHFGAVLPVPLGASGRAIDERAVLHNMEHGAVVVWFDPATVDGREREQIADWRDARHDLGFTSRAGGAVFASPLPETADTPAVALRAWGVAMDCDRFDPIVADAFLVDHWGSHGAAPESELSPFPDDALHFEEDA